MSILKLAAQLSLDGTRFKAGLKEAEVASTRFGNEIASSLKGSIAGVFGAGAMVAFVGESLKAVANFKDLAEQAHMTTDQVQIASAAAEDMGLSFGDVANAERKFNSNRKEAVETNMELRDTFERYGVTLQDLQNPQFKFWDFILKANSAMEGFDSTEMQRGLNDMGEILGDRVGPKLQEFIKGIKELNGMSLVPKEEIERADKAMGRLAAGKRLVMGRMGMFVSETLSGENWGTKFGPGGVFRFWKTMLTGKGMGSSGAAKSETSAPTGDLFQDTVESKAAKKAAEEAKKAAEKATEAALKQEKEIADYNFKQLSKDDQRQAIIASLDEQMNTESPDRGAILDLLKQLPAEQNQRGEQSSLARVGQWQGMNYQNANESPVVLAAKALLAPATRTAVATEKIAAKRELTINAGGR